MNFQGRLAVQNLVVINRAWKERSRNKSVAALVQQRRRVEGEDVAHLVAAGLWE